MRNQTVDGLGPAANVATGHFGQIAMTPTGKVSEGNGAQALGLRVASKADLASDMLGKCVLSGFPAQRDPIQELAAIIAEFEKSDSLPDWRSFWAVDEDAAVVGLCGFKGPPIGGAIEIAYFTFPNFEGRGHATSMVTALCRHARRSADVVVAHTLPEPNASNRVLQRCGFEFGGTAFDPEDGEVWRWLRPLTPACDFIGPGSLPQPADS